MICFIRFSMRGEVLLRDRLAEDEVVVEAVGDRRAEAQRRPRAELHHRLREHVREAVANAVEILLFVAIDGLFHVGSDGVCKGAGV